MVEYTSMDEALALIEDGDILSVGLYGCQPVSILRRLHTIDRENITVWVTNPSGDYPFVGMENFFVYSGFYNASFRQKHATGRISFVPDNLHQLAWVMRAHHVPNVFMAACTEPDEEGYVCLPLSDQVEDEMSKSCEKIILEINPNLPRTYGSVRIHRDRVAAFVRADGDVLTLDDSAEATPEELAIAHYVAEFIRDGDTVQFGIGTLPNAVAAKLGDKKDLGIHTEMLGSAMGRLMVSGNVTNKRKTLCPDVSVTAFSYGDAGLYRFLHENEKVLFRPVRWVADPVTIAQNDNMVSVNTALQIDLSGQVCSESLGFRMFSGTGGATDFANGAFNSKGGRGIVCIQSTAKNGTISRIQPGLSYGSGVSIGRDITDIIVTEYGVAYMRGRGIRERAEQLIAIAHPDFRDQLRDEMKKNMIW